MQRSRLLLGLAVAFGAMTLALGVVGAVSNPAILAPAALFGVVTYVLWAHGTGRLAARVYRRVEERAAANGGHRGAARRTGPRRGRRARREQATDTTDRRQVGAAPTTDGPSVREARALLGVEADADGEAIRDAYRERVRDVHPDAQGGDAAAFKRVTAAYETLREHGRRQ